MQGRAGFISSLHIGDRFGCFISLNLVLFFRMFLAADYREGYLFILFHHYEFVGLGRGEVIISLKSHQMTF